MFRNSRVQERFHLTARAKAKVGETSLKRPFQFKKSIRGEPEERESHHELSSWVGSAEMRRRVLLVPLVRNVLAEQQMIARSRLWKRNTMFAESEKKVITSFIKLQVLGPLRGQDVHYAPNVTDGSTPPLVGNDQFASGRFINSSILLCPGNCWLEIPSRGIKAKLMVTTLNRALVNMTDFGDDLENRRRCWLRIHLMSIGID